MYPGRHRHGQGLRRRTRKRRTRPLAPSRIIRPHLAVGATRASATSCRGRHVLDRERGTSWRPITAGSSHAAVMRGMVSISSLRVVAAGHCRRAEPAPRPLRNDRRAARTRWNRWRVDRARPLPLIAGRCWRSVAVLSINATAPAGISVRRRPGSIHEQSEWEPHPARWLVLIPFRVTIGRRAIPQMWGRRGSRPGLGVGRRSR